MNNVSLTIAEINATKAEDLKAFSGIKLSHIKNKTAEILSLIGRDGIFDQYTKHDISHVNEMLKMLEWIIPENTAKIMSPADWLMIVLAIYFHDLGMLVTKDEYNEREKSEFPIYKRKVYEGEFGLDYKQKVINLGNEEAEKFLYQEFVRHSHAGRIKYWIQGINQKNHGKCEKQVKEINQLLGHLPSIFRRDLGLICESHQLSDLNEFDKYKISQPYGNTENEVVNMHYTSVLLRTVDLLHITSDRTPTTEFNLINPSDPISLIEWYKQMAVTAVRPKSKVDKDGKINDKLKKDTIEVHAFFDKPNKADGFFGLISYINYAKNEIQKSNKSILEAIATKASKYEFPWTDIDDTNIETQGFEKKLFEFKLDQPKILDLLVGHTLYNDQTVVLRELIQNSIDAIKLQYIIDQKNLQNATLGKILVKLDSNKNELSIIDTGTGMTHQIIESYLLKVGSSRYQDDEFKKQFPDFSPISRFGIGVLTCFLIADDVDIITCHPNEEMAIKLSIKKLHGKYLMQYIQNGEFKDTIFPHGTQIKLILRNGIDKSMIKKGIEKWILFPACEVSLIIDGTEPKRIGFGSPKEALEVYLTDLGYDIKDSYLRVKEDTLNGVTLAYVVQHLEYFKEWTFLERKRMRDSEDRFNPIGTCIEGIRVGFDSPGFDGKNLIAIANAQGKNSPKTNVSRSILENTTEMQNLLRNIYIIYSNHINGEIINLYKDKGFSLTWASQEGYFLLSPIFDIYGNSWDGKEEKFVALNPKLLMEAINDIPCILVEKERIRNAYSPRQIHNEPDIWTIDCGLFRSAEEFIKEIPSSLASLGNFLEVIDPKYNQSLKDSKTILCGFSYYNSIHRNAIADKEVDCIKIFPKERRVDLRWVPKFSESRWIEFGNEFEPNQIIYVDDFSRFHERKIGKFLIQKSKIDIQGTTDEIAIISFDHVYLLDNSEFYKYMLLLHEKMKRNSSIENRSIVSIINNIFNSYLRFHKEIDNNLIEENISSIIEEGRRRNISREMIWNLLERTELLLAIRNTNWNIFDSSVWSRR